MKGWLEALAAARAAGRPAVLVTVVSAEGSTPREAGAKLVVTDLGFDGTVGGGHLELEALAEARRILAAAAGGGAVPAPRLREFALGPALGQCCGGRSTLLFEAVFPPRWTVALFGAGHVGKALVRLLGELPCQVLWIDSREAEFPAELPGNVRKVLVDEPAGEVATLPAGADVLVMTHSHAVDQEIVEAVLKQGGHRYLGLIGSLTKRARFVQRLAARGRTAEELATLTCPIGIPGAHGKAPMEIAIAVAAQLLQLNGADVSARPAPRVPASAEASVQERPHG